MLLSKYNHDCLRNNWPTFINSKKDQLWLTPHPPASFSVLILDSLDAIPETTALFVARILLTLMNTPRSDLGAGFLRMGHLQNEKREEL